MAVAKKLITAEEFWLLPEHAYAELIDGKVVERMRPGGVHGNISSAINYFLRGWVLQSGAGTVRQESGFILGRSPNKVRGPDVYFVSKNKVPAEGIPEKFWEVAPDLAVEVISPSDTVEVIKEKLEDYFGAGTSEVWLVYPKAKQVEACSPSGVTKVFRESDTLQAPDLLPGFKLRP